MNSAKLSLPAAAPANKTVAVDGLAFQSPAGTASIDVIGDEAATEFQCLIEDLLPDTMERGLPTADPGVAGNAAGIVTDTPAQAANPDLATAQLLLQLAFFFFFDFG